MSTRELERVEVTGRVANEELQLTDAAAMLQLSDLSRHSLTSGCRVLKMKRP